MEINILKTEIPYQPYHTVCNEIQSRLTGNKILILSGIIKAKSQSNAPTNAYRKKWQTANTQFSTNKNTLNDQIYTLSNSNTTYLELEITLSVSKKQVVQR